MVLSCVCKIPTLWSSILHRGHQTSWKSED